MGSRAFRFASTRLTAAAFVACGLAVAATHLRADGPLGRSFTTLAGGFTQELVGISNDLGNPDDFPILGGVAFAPNGDVWSSECVFGGTRLHRFYLDEAHAYVDHETTLHHESIVQTAGGCGLTNHPDGALYSNSSAGIWKLDAETGLPLRTDSQPVEAEPQPMGPGGNALGIAVDPQTHHLVYVGSDCHPSLNPDPGPSPTCTIWDLNPATGVAGVFARLSRHEFALMDGIYFDPLGAFLFGAHRDPGVAGPDNSLQIIRRPAALGAADMPVNDLQVANTVPMESEPDGVAFHATQGFVVTLDESAGGTMTRFDFPGGNFAELPTVSPFASGGFRGDLLQVGGDGCVYATQGVLFNEFGAAGVRFDNGDEDVANSIVKICGGFAVPPGVSSPGEGKIGDFVWEDVNQDGLQDSSEPGIGGLEVTLSGPDGTQTTTTDGSGHYLFTGLKAGSYAVTVTQPLDLIATTTGVGSDRAIDSNGSPASVSLETNTSEDLTIDFGYHVRPATLAGFAYVDSNRNLVKDDDEDGIPGVEMTLAGPTAGTQLTGADGSYHFTNLVPGSYQVNAPSAADGKALETPTPLSATLAANQDATDLNFGYVPGRLSGFAFEDTNRNGSKDGGEPGIGGVTMTLDAFETTTTASDGSYAFEDLDEGTHAVVAPATAAAKSRSTASPLSVMLAAGEDHPNVNFGYVPGSIAGFAYVDANRNSAKDTGESVIAGVVISLAGGGTATTGADGAYSFINLNAGNHSVSAPATAGSKALFTASPLSVMLGAGEARTDVNFGYVPGSIAGFAFVDTNNNGVKDGSEPGIGGVGITLSGTSSGVTTTGADGSYSFASLNSGARDVSAPATADGKHRSTASPLSVDLGAGEDRANVNFGYVPGSISGYAYVDVNNNGSRQVGEPGIGGVTISLGGAGTATTATVADGSYSFIGLNAGGYAASAPVAAAGKSRSTPSPLSVTLAAGDARTDVNFGYVPGSISGFAYVDSNNSGVKDSGEPGIGGVSISLGGTGSTVMATVSVTTAADGSYSFPTLDSGTYNDAAPSSAAGHVRSTASPLGVALGAGEARTNVNFGYVPGSISGYAYVDSNNNGVKDSGEPGISGVTITRGGASSGTTTTASNGSYTFSSLVAGSYTASAPSTAAGKNRSTASPLNVALAAGEARTNVNFGYVPGSISGFAYADLNKNSVKDAGEPGIASVSITLAGASGATATTAADGSYTFTTLNAAAYTVAAPTVAAGKLRSTPSPLSVNLAAGEARSNVNFGYVTGSISGCTYIDRNSNGVKDSCETCFSGVTITLSGAASGSAVTNSDGEYSFVGLNGGSYQVSAPATAGGRNRTSPSPLTVVLNAGENRTNVNFGYSRMPYTGYTQGGWGAAPNGNNPGALLANRFTQVFGSAGVTIGGTYTLKFTSSSAIQNFLPAGGTPGVISASKTNPTSSTAGVFAGQLLALKLNVSFSNAGYLPGGLASLKVAAGYELAGYTVTQVLSLANTVLGGNTSALPSGVTLSELNDVLSRINQNFDNGTADNGFLVP